MTKRAITYARVSSNDKLRTGGENLADQTRLCREYALRQGYEVTAELAEDDRGASGATFDLPELNKALEMAREGLFDVFVVRELDRLARDIAKQYIVEQEFKVAGVTIEYALYDFPETPEGQLQKCIYAAFAEFERAKIKERMSRGRRRKVQAGNVIMHGKQLYGYRVIEDNGKKQLEIDENEAEIVRLVFSEYTQGKGLKAIAAQLTQMGVMTRRDIESQQNGTPTPETLKKRGRGEWCIATVYDMICNETYAGVWRYGNEQIVVNVPAIIDREVWKAAQEQRDINKETSPRNTKYDYLLRRRLICGSCGKSMRAVRRYSGKRDYFYYVCPAIAHGVYVEDCQNGRNFRADQVDASAWNWICEKFKNEEVLRAFFEEEQAERERCLLPYRQELETVSGLIAKHNKEREKLLDLYLAGDFPKDMLTERKARVENALASLQKQQARLEAIISSQELNAQQIQAILDLGRKLREGIRLAKNDFGARRQMIEFLNFTGTLTVEGNEKVLNIHCVIGDERLLIASTRSVSGRNSTNLSHRRSS